VTVTRTEYYDDPGAPEPNSMVVAASAVVTDDHGRILLQRRLDNGLWALPGGGTELTDSLPGTAVREVKQETGLDVARLPPPAQQERPPPGPPRCPAEGARTRPQREGPALGRTPTAHRGPTGSSARVSQRCCRPGKNALSAAHTVAPNSNPPHGIPPIGRCRITP
jgi:8-oxo-dGTP pyrophosphatase MutT (NUDIX family)